MGSYVLAAQMSDERIVSRVAGDDVKEARRIEHGCAANVVGEREVEGIAP